MLVLKQTKERRCGLKPQRRKDNKILHEMLGNGVFRFIF